MVMWKEQAREYFNSLTGIANTARASIEETMATNDPVQICGAIEGALAASTMGRMLGGQKTTHETTAEFMLGCRAYVSAWDAIEFERAGTRL